MARLEQRKTTMDNVLHMLLGAALVSTGVLASALADRIRGLRSPRANVREPREDRPEPRVRRASGTPAQGVAVIVDGADDIIEALMGMGFKRPLATKAVAACAPQDRQSPESWARAALRIAGGKQ